MSVVPIIENNNLFYTSAWNDILAKLKVKYGESVYKNWFSKISFSSKTAHKVVLAAPSTLIRDWVKNNYLHVLSKYWNDIDAKVVFIDIVVDKSLAVAFTYKVAESNFLDIVNHISAESYSSSNELTGGFDNSNPIKKNFLYAESEPMNFRYNFSNFVLDSTNEFAYRACLSVAESSDAKYESNPLVVYGNVGFGKTHLLQAIVNYKMANKSFPSKRIVYMSAGKFMYHFVKALKNKDIIQFKDEFRSVDVLIIDDIQFIAGKDSTQAEFFDVFNSLIENNCQVIIACDRAPNKLSAVDDRLKSRLACGLMVDIQPGSYLLRKNIINAKLTEANIELDESIIDFIATKIVSSVRELEGALNKVLAHMKLRGGISLVDVQKLLQDMLMLQINSGDVSILSIQEKVAGYFDISVADLLSSKRPRLIAESRQIAMFLCRTLTDKSLVDIGKAFGNRDHTTVMYALKKIGKMAHEDTNFLQMLNDFML